METFKEFVFDNLSSFQALRSYALSYDLEKVYRVANDWIDFSLGLETCYGTELENYGPGYFQMCAMTAIERLARDYNLSSKGLIGNFETISEIVKLISVLL